MRCSIMQPTYLPWPGYFSLINHSDYFVFLDDAQFQRSSYHHRNQIVINHKAQWLTVPVIRSGLNQSILSAELNDEHTWRDKHLKTIRQVYKNHPYYDVLEKLQAMIDNTAYKRLVDLNIDIIKYICSILNIQTQFHRASDLGLDAARTNKIIDICRHLSCDQYLSTEGAKDYLTEDDFTGLSKDIVLYYQEFKSAPYCQLGESSFISHLSVVDLIANVGPKQAKSYLVDNAVIYKDIECLPNIL